MDYFSENGYKFILSLGLLAAENVKIKTVCAERGVIFTVLECLKQHRFSSALSKWCLWALMVSQFFMILIFSNVKFLLYCHFLPAVILFYTLFSSSLNNLFCLSLSLTHAFFSQIPSLFQPSSLTHSLSLSLSSLRI